MTVPDNAYELAMELQSLTYDMSMLENLRRSTSDLRWNIELHVDDGVYADGDNAGRMATTIEALKKLEDRCDDAIMTLSKREQEVVWELSGKTTGIPDPFECPFCGSGAVLSEYSFACDSEAYVGVKCTRCEDVSGPDVQAVEFFGMSNPWRPSRKEGVKDTLKEATIEAVKLWNRRVYGGRPKVPVLMRAWSKCTNWSNEGIEAKPCPLCGGDPEIILNIGYYKDVWDAQMICRDCSMTGPRAYGIDDAWMLDPDAIAADHPTLEQVRAEHPGITILESRKAAYAESINAWNHRACGREVSE